MCREWYPKINEILFGPSHPLPYSRIPIIFDDADSFEGMVIHELTHVVQAYPKNGEWLG